MKLLILGSLLVFLYVGPCALAQNETTEAAAAAENSPEPTQENNMMPESVTEAMDQNTTMMHPSRLPVDTEDQEPEIQLIDNNTIFSEGDCPQGMYGKQCMYKCQCEPVSCDGNGVCQNGAKCKASRFGDRCQESNLAVGSIRAGITLLDGDASTCMAEGSVEAPVEFVRPLPVSFIRVKFMKKVEADQFKPLQFRLFGRGMKQSSGDTDTHDQAQAAPSDTAILPPSTTTGVIPVNEAPVDEEQPAAVGDIDMNKTTSTPAARAEGGDGAVTAAMEGNVTEEAGVRRRDMEANATATAEGNDTMAENGNATAEMEPASLEPIHESDDENTTLVPTTPPHAVPEVASGTCKIEETDKAQELDRSMVSFDYHIHHVDVILNQSVLVSGMMISGENLENVCEVYASGGIDFGPRGLFFEAIGQYMKPVTLHDRFYKREDCVKGPNEKTFPEIAFESNASFILVHVELELDWDYPNTAKKGMITVTNEDGSMVWREQVCASRNVIIGEPYARKNINQIRINGDPRLPPVCAVFVYGMCSLGYYGRDCEQRCSPYCSPEGCDSNTGVCKDCAIGYFGDMCEKTCPIGCKEGSRCHRAMGHCMEGCKPGKFPPTTCDFECSQGCAENGECDAVTRECKFGCKVGHFMKSCERECKGCAGDGSCNIDSGECSAGCIQGYYGDMCDTKCSSDCESGCQMKTGVCLSCPPGKTGDLCNEACNNCAGDGRCDQRDRSCLHGCLPGFKGLYCADETEFAAAYLSERPENLMMVGVVIAVGLVLLAVVIVAGVCSMKKKPESQKKQNAPGSYAGMDKVSVSPPAQTGKEFSISYEPIKDEFGTLV